MVKREDNDSSLSMRAPSYTKPEISLRAFRFELIEGRLAGVIHVLTEAA